MNGMASRALDPRFFLGANNPFTPRTSPAYSDEEMAAPDLGMPSAPNYASAFSPTRQPSFEGTDEYQQYSDVGNRLRQALQPNQVSMPRALIGAFLSRRNPTLGSIVTGDYQRQRQIQPLEQQFGLLGDIIKNNRAMQTQDITNEKNRAETGYYNAHSQQLLNPPLKPKEEDWSVVPGAVGPNGEPLQQEKNSGQIRIAPLPGASMKDTSKAPNAVEGVRQSLLDALNKGDKESAAKYGKQLELLSDPTGDKAAQRQLTMELARQRIADNLKKQTALSPKAQGVLMETEPTLQQVDQLIAKLEPMKDDNSTRLTFSRIGYALGHASPEGSLADDISKLELDRVVAGARVLKGSSRAYQALEMAMKHAPNAWVDTPKLMYNKLLNIRQNLADVENDAKNLGAAKLSTGQAEASTSSNQSPGGKYGRPKPNVVVEQ